MGLDLKNLPASKRFTERFEHDFAHLRDALRDDARGRREVYLRRLDEHLSAIAQAAPQLADKCAHLQRQLGRLREWLEGEA